MKSLIVFAFLLFAANGAFAQPDIQDSVIIESKAIAFSNGPVAVKVRVWITNKDSLTGISMPLVESSQTGGAYMTLARPRSASGVYSRLVSTLPMTSVNFNFFHSDSPDTLAAAFFFDATDDFTLEPPNPARKAFVDIKFDTVFSSLGTIELDSGRFVGADLGFYDRAHGNDIVPVNFVKGTITVVAARGDLNADGGLSPADVVWILNCVNIGAAPPNGSTFCDLNCDGMNSPADIVLELNAVFVGEGFPC